MWKNDFLLFVKKRSKIFLFSALSFILGIALASFLPRDIFYFSGEIFGAGLLFFSVFFVLTRSRTGLKIIGLWFLFFFLGFLRLAVAIPEDSPESIAHYHGERVGIRAQVSDQVVSGLDKQQIEVEVLDLSSVDTEVSGRILLTTGLYPEYRYGEILEIEGFLQAPPDFPDFAYSRYLAKEGIYSVIYYPDIKRLGEIDLSFSQKIKQNIFAFKDRLSHLVERGLGDPEAALVKAMVLGDKSTVPPDLRDDFSRAGISHITAISGMHIGILAALVFQVLLSLGFARKRVFIFSCFFLVFYIFLIGLPASAVRAGAMGILLLLSFNLGRFAKTENLIVLAAASMLVFNPFLLRDDLGFQLSFLAVSGIWYFYPLSNHLRQLHQNNFLFKSISDVLIITLAAQILTLPLIAYNFSHISLLAPLANLLVLWTLPFILILSLIGLILSLVYPFLARVFFLPVDFLISYVAELGQFISSLSWGVLMVESSFWWWIFYYVLLLLLILAWRKRDFFWSFREKVV